MTETERHEIEITLSASAKELVEEILKAQTDISDIGSSRELPYVGAWRGIVRRAVGFSMLAKKLKGEN